MMSESIMDYKTLICINTCKRLDFVKLFCIDYINFCSNDTRFKFIISLDGNANDYIDFFSIGKISYVYSEEIEGVGFSKNRVLKIYPNFDFYFFIDDDVELINYDYFDQQIQIALKSGIHHFSVGNIEYFYNKSGSTIVDGIEIDHYMYGPGTVNFFTSKGIEKVGGWHSIFAKYKRFGHTEHSYRLYNNGLCPSPFNVVKKFTTGFFRWYDPPSVTKYFCSQSELDNYGIADVEVNVIHDKLKVFPITTFSKYYFVDYTQSSEVFKKGAIAESSDIFIKINKSPFLGLTSKINIFFKLNLSLRRVFQSMFSKKKDKSSCNFFDIKMMSLIFFITIKKLKKKFI
jgi:hypothetical protein